MSFECVQLSVKPIFQVDCCSRQNSMVICVNCLEYATVRTHVWMSKIRYSTLKQRFLGGGSLPLNPGRSPRVPTEHSSNEHRVHRGARKKRIHLCGRITALNKPDETR